MKKLDDFVFEIQNNKWVKSKKSDPNKRAIFLYDLINGEMKIIGIGTF